MRARKSGKWSHLSCHSGPVEVIPNLFCGSLQESAQMVSPPVLVDVLVPLDSLDPKIWGLGFRGEILYFPIEDYWILPDEVLADLVSKIIDRLNSGKKVGLFCLGGHGRTGYVASAVLGKLGYEDPIGFLRKKYCRRAVESDAQINHIAQFLNRPKLFDEYALQNMYRGLYDCFGFDLEPFVKTDSSPICGSCTRFQEGICWQYEAFVSGDQGACDAFSERLNDRKKD